MENILKGDKAEETLNPWVSIDPDPLSQSGGDWYQLFLCASFRGKGVHGANTSPSCEVLCKANRAAVESNVYGSLHWNEKLKHDSVLGNDISDKFYTYPPYRGTITTSGSMLAYESGMWEPSVRKRARSSALLAAGLVVHGSSIEDACHIVGKMTGEPLDREAVDSAILPASHLKREMVLVSKASHRVFSRGTIQTGLLWNDSRLTVREQERNVAFDWGRVTSIARYIGEANVQNCPTFRSIAKSIGVPYVVIRNAWAYVADTDYMLSARAFANIPDIDIAKLGIPSLRGTFVGHEQDVMIALNRGSKHGISVPESDAFTAYVNLMANATAREGRRKRLKVAPTSTAREVTITEHSLTEADVRDVVKGSKAIRQAFLMAIASKRSVDRELDQLLTTVSSCDADSEGDYHLIDEASRALYGKAIWIHARVIAESFLEEDDTGDVARARRDLASITKHLMESKKELVGYWSHLESDVKLPNSQLAKLRETTILNAKASGGELPVATYTQRTLVSRPIRGTTKAMAQVMADHSESLDQLRTRVADIYEGWYERALTETSEVVRLGLVHFAYICEFLRSISAEICFQKTSGYIEGTAPRRSYVYQGVLRTGYDYGFVPPKLKRPAYISAEQIAEEFDQQGIIPYKVTSCVKEVIAVADLVVGELLHGKVWEPRMDTYAEACVPLEPPLSPGYDTSMMQEGEELAQAMAMMAEFEKNRKKVFLEGYDSCLNTYPTEAYGNKLARAMGYGNLRQAYDVLGLEAYYSEDSAFVNEARAKIALCSEGPSSPGDPRADDYGDIM